MPHLVILGGGTAGAMAANLLSKRVPDLQITVVDPGPDHFYQPGYLFAAVNAVKRPHRLRRPLARQLRAGITLIKSGATRIEPDAQTVDLDNDTTLTYDWLIIATGTTPRALETPGMADDLGGAVHEFYTFDGSIALGKALAGMTAGHLVVHVTEMPIKCPVAPLEFAFLADAYLTKRGVRDQVQITFVTPLPGAFTKPVASTTFGNYLTERNIAIEPDFVIERVDPNERRIVSYDEREVSYDLLVTVPLNMGADVVQESGLGDELGFVEVNKHTMQSLRYDNVFALGDAADLPTSKAGSVAHFAIHEFVANFEALLTGKPMPHAFDGHANCFIETGFGKAMLIDFNYEVEPLPGAFPLPVVGPLALLKPTRRNHWAKLAFEWVYWHMLVPGRPVPFPSKLSMTGKDTSALTRT